MLKLCRKAAGPGVFPQNHPEGEKPATHTLLWIAAAAVVGSGLLLIGLGVAALLHREAMAPAEDLLVGLGAAIIVPAVVALLLIPLPVSFVTAVPPIVLVLLVASAGFVWRRRAWLLALSRDPVVRLMTAGIAIAALIGVLVAASPWDWHGAVDDAGLVTSRHVPLMPGDSYLQYRTAQFIQNRLPPFTTPFVVDWFITDRTPLIGLVTAFVASAVRIQLPTAVILGQPYPYQLIDPFGYWLYRLVGLLTNALVVAPAVMLAARTFGVARARLGLIFTLLSPFILINLLFAWPKLLAGFFIVTFYYWSAARTRPALAGSAAAGAFFSHPLAILWFPGMLVYVLIRRGWLPALVSTATIGILIIPWFLWASVLNHHPSRMLTYPIGYFIKDPTRAASETAAAWQVFIHRPILSILNDHWVTIRDTLIDWPLLVAMVKGHSLHNLRWPIYDLFRVSFPGIFGLPLALWGYLSWRRILTSGFWLAALGIPTLLTFIYWGIAPRAITIEGFQPGAVIWICLAAALLAGSGPLWVRIIAILSAIEWLIFTYGLLLQTPALGHWRPSEALLVGACLLVVGAVCGWAWRSAASAEGG